jgi:hypothetical protein
MRVAGLRTRLLIAVGLPLGSCSPTEPAETPPPPGPDDAGAEAAWSVSIETPTEAEVDASLESDAGDAGPVVELTDAGAADGAVVKTRPPSPSWHASYKLAPGQEKWCKFGNTQCMRAEDVVGVNDGKKHGCPTAIEVKCPCTPAGCKSPDAMCVAGLYAPVTFRERAKVKNACCYDLPRQCVPPWVGRPLVASNGSIVTTRSLPRDDWRTTLDMTELERADETTRAERARSWKQIGNLEHASVASFAKVSLQLLALGAPPDLLIATHRAALDEIEHARLAYSVASASSDGPIGPASLPLDSIELGTCTLAELAGETFRDGCVGETLGVVVAEELLSNETSPTLASVLARIVSDEERHAELAWRTVAWALRTGGPAVRTRVEIELARALSETDPESTRSEVMRELIEPCARALLAL